MICPRCNSLTKETEHGTTMCCGANIKPSDIDANIIPFQLDNDRKYLLVCDCGNIVPSKKNRKRVVCFDCLHEKSLERARKYTKNRYVKVADRVQAGL